MNTAAIIVGGSIGLLLKKGLPDKIADTVMKGLGLCVIYIGIDGCLEGQNTLITILSVAIGAVLGEILDLDGKINRLGQFLEQKVGRNGVSDDESSEKKDIKKGSKTKTTVAQGFVTASLLFCVGAMAIVGSLNSGLSHNHEMLFTKSLLDFIAAIIFSASLGAGVLFSAALVFVYQGAITLLAQFIAPFLSAEVIAEVTCVGSVLIIGLGLNMLSVTKLKVMNLVPAIFLPILFCIFL